MALLMAGGFSGVCFWALCFPMDVVKTVLQTDASNPAERTYKFVLAPLSFFPAFLPF